MARRVTRRSPGVAQRIKALERLLKEKRPKSELETLCIQRAITDLEREKRNGLVWREDEAARNVEFCRLLNHWQGPLAGAPFNLEPWQEHLIIAPLFGWYRSADQRRRFTESYIEVPRKNGKTFMAAALLLQGLVADGESGPEVYALATKKDQAKIVFRDASNAVRKSPLYKLLNVMQSSILFEANGGFIKPLSNDEGGGHGTKPSRAVIDELHSHRTRDLYDVINTGTGSRRQPLIVSITTAGHDRSSICWEIHQRAVQTLHGNADHQSFHTYIACADPDDDWTDPATWWKANPNLGVSCFEDKLADDCQKAQESPSYENKFRRLHLNQWTEQAVRWIPMHAWDDCVGKVDPDRLRGDPCYAGLDLASTRDVNALVLAFPRRGGRVTLLPFFWVPERAENQRAEQDRAKVMHWAKEGHIRLTDGTVADVDGQIPEDILEICRQYEVRLLGYDPWGCAEAVVQKLVKGGFPLSKITKYRQIMSNLAGPTVEFERLILDRKLAHGGNPVLRWMASNVAVKTDSSGNVRPDKEKSADKIDGIVAAIMAIGVKLLQDEAPTPSYYDTHALESG